MSPSAQAQNKQMAANFGVLIVLLSVLVFTASGSYSSTFSLFASGSNPCLVVFSSSFFLKRNLQLLWKVVTKWMHTDFYNVYI